MAIMAMFIGRGMSTAVYDKLRAEALWETNVPPGAVLHVAAVDAAGDMRVTDIWESQEALDAFFADRLGPAFQRLGEAMPEVELMTVAHNINAYPAVDRYKV